MRAREDIIRIRYERDVDKEIFQMNEDRPRECIIQLMNVLFEHSRCLRNSKCDNISLLK